MDLRCGGRVGVVDSEAVAFGSSGGSFSSGEPGETGESRSIFSPSVCSKAAQLVRRMRSRVSNFVRVRSLSFGDQMPKTAEKTPSSGGF